MPLRLRPARAGDRTPSLAGSRLPVETASQINPAALQVPRGARCCCICEFCSNEIRGVVIANVTSTAFCLSLLP